MFIAPSNFCSVPMFFSYQKDISQKLHYFWRRYYPYQGITPMVIPVPGQVIVSVEGMNLLYLQCLRALETVGCVDTETSTHSEMNHQVTVGVYKYVLAATSERYIQSPYSLLNPPTKKKKGMTCMHGNYRRTTSRSDQCSVSTWKMEMTRVVNDVRTTVLLASKL